MNYQEFLKAKMQLAQDTGFSIAKKNISAILKPHQRDAVQWCICGGCRAIFASFGLGKTAIQIEIARQIVLKTGKQFLIVCPLGVKQEFKRDAKNLFNLEIEYVRTMDEVHNCKSDIMITNYERVRDGNIDPHFFGGVSLDEAGTLRSYGSKTYQTFLTLFKGIEYKFVATAVPSPNRYKELIHYAGYLGIMDTGQALTRFFKRNPQKANDLMLYPHKEKEFWLWLSSWALFITKPSDLGYDDTGYSIPEMEIIYHKLPVDHLTAGFDEDGQGKLYRDSAIGLKDAATEKRDWLYIRIEKAADIISKDPDSHYLIWHDLEIERHLIKKLIPGAVMVYGSETDLEAREQKVLDFSDGKIKLLATKPILSGSGCNFQRHCHKAIFTGIGYKFNDFIQAIHRIHRFLQKEKVEIHIVYMESEEEILKTLLKKWQQYNILVENMTEIIKENGLSNVNSEQKLHRAIGVEYKIKKTDLYTAIQNDCILEYEKLPDNIFHLGITSIPFSNHYEYTPTYNDFGHTNNDDHFFEQMDYLTPHLLRTLKPGRIFAVHVKDRIMFGNVTGYGCPTVNPFHMKTTFHFLKHGFIFIGMITIETDVVRENNQTYRLGWSEQCKDGSKMGVGCPEYILIFRKLPTDTSKGYADEPVSKSKKDYPRGQWQIDARGKWNSSGNRLLSSDEIKSYPLEQINNIFEDFFDKNIYDYEVHKNTAIELERLKRLPATFQMLNINSRDGYVWHDINRMNTLNSEQSRKNLEMHICPLQIDIVDRLINRYSSKGETVGDPFAGLFTVPYRAVMLGRKGFGTELNETSYNDGLRYLRAAEQKINVKTLFDIEEF